jgi:prepilin peptidase CpaA
MFEVILLFAFPWLIILAATSDLFTMTIPNRLVLALTAAFFIAAPFSHLGLAEIGMHVATCLGMLTICFFLFTLGVMGGGDAKLAAAIALWLGFDQTLQFLFVTALAGGALTLGLLFGRQAAGPLGSASGPFHKIMKPDGDIPYGLAISFAAMVVYADSPWMHRLIDHLI